MEKNNQNFNQSTIYQKIVDNVDIVEVISTYIDVVHKGNTYKAVCPFHNDTNPSLSISPKKKVYRCFSCGNGGNVITFVANYEHISREQAVIKLAKKLGIELKPQREIPEDEKRYFQAMDLAVKFYQFYLYNTNEGVEALEYLKRRGINKEHIDYFKIGLAPKKGSLLHNHLNQQNIDKLTQRETGLLRNNFDSDLFNGRIMFPLYDGLNRPVGFSGRIYLPDDNNPKYLNSPETKYFQKSELLYHLYQAQPAIKQKGTVYVLEGFMDVIACVKSQITNVVATMGTALTTSHIRSLLKLTDKIVLCFDGDSAGVTATTRALGVFSSMQAKVVPLALALPEGLDPDEYQKKYGENELRNFFTQKVNSIYEYLYSYYLNKTDLSSLTSVNEFRRNILNMMGKMEDQTFISYYTKKLSQALNIDVNDLQNQWRVNQRFVKTEVHEDEPKVTTTPPIDIISGFERALSYVIICGINNKDRFAEFWFAYENEYASEYEQYFNLIYHIKDLYASSKLEDNSSENLSIVLASLTNEQIKDLLIRISEDEMSGVDDIIVFKQCLGTIAEFFENEKIRHQLVQARLNKDPETVEKYLDMRRKSIKIKKE